MVAFLKKKIIFSRIFTERHCSRVDPALSDAAMLPVTVEAYNGFLASSSAILSEIECRVDQRRNAARLLPLHPARIIEY
jgi:hypothetical protein